MIEHLIVAFHHVHGRLPGKQESGRLAALAGKREIPTDLLEWANINRYTNSDAKRLVAYANGGYSWTALKP
jgi:hypothetical protein